VDGPATASPDDRHDQLLDASLLPSQPLTVEVLRRPVESAQYTSLAFGRRLQQAGLVASMGTVGDALDNAVAESFFATLECELLDRHAWPTRQGLRTAVFDFIEVFYNRQRRHSTLGYASPLPAMSSTHQPHPPHNHRVHESGATPTLVGQLRIATPPVGWPTPPTGVQHRPSRVGEDRNHTADGTALTNFTSSTDPRRSVRIATGSSPVSWSRIARRSTDPSGR
jgi:Integrase core domain